MELANFRRAMTKQQQAQKQATGNRQQASGKQHANCNATIAEIGCGPWKSKRATATNDDPIDEASTACSTIHNPSSLCKPYILPL